MMLIDYHYIDDYTSYRLCFSRGRHIVIRRDEYNDEIMSEEVLFEGHERECRAHMQELKTRHLEATIF